jgi:L-lactate dehydrogenase complex protein LldF
VREHALRHLDHYLGIRSTQRARDNGSSVHFARDGEELNAAGAGHLPSRRGAADRQGQVHGDRGNRRSTPPWKPPVCSVRETDLGEYIIQQAGETPSHIVGPALHKPEAEIRELFLERHDARRAGTRQRRGHGRGSTAGAARGVSRR